MKKKSFIGIAALKSALGTVMPPDTTAAAKKIGITEAELLDALGFNVNR